eukprot:scaffold122030_cov50-Cyclotella_meneghiniana.AAC.1
MSHHEYDEWQAKAEIGDPHSLPMSHHEYDEWQDKDEIGAHSLKLSRMILAPGSPHFTPKLRVFDSGHSGLRAPVYLVRESSKSSLASLTDLAEPQANHDGTS